MEVRVRSDIVGEPIAGAVPKCAIDARTSSILLLGRDVLANWRSDVSQAGAGSGVSSPIPSIWLRIYPRRGMSPTRLDTRWRIPRVVVALFQAMSLPHAGQGINYQQKRCDRDR